MALQNKICVGCSKQFEGRPNAKACSSKCRKRFFRARQAVKQEVEKLAELRDEIKQDIHGSLSLPQLAPAVADEVAEDSELESPTDNQPPFLDDLSSSQAVMAPKETQAAPPVSQDPVQPSVQTSFQPVEEPVFSQPPIISLEPPPPAPDKWEQLQNSWQNPAVVPAPQENAQAQAPVVDNAPAQAPTIPGSGEIQVPALLESTPYEAPTLENAPSSPVIVPEMPAAPKGPTNWFKNKPLSVTLAFVVLISLASGVFAITGLLRGSPENQTGLSLQQDTTDDSLLNVKDAKLTLNLDTTIVTKLGIGTVPTGDASLQVAGDIQSTATIFASGGGSSLSNAGLTINNVVVCTAAGCASNVAGVNVLLQNAVLGTQQIGNIYISGTVTAGNFSGSGAGLTGVNAAKLEGNAASFFTNASNLNTGTLADARLSSNVSLLGQTIDSGEILDGTITNVDIAAGAAITYAKLNLAASITNTDIATGAAIAYSKLNLAGSVVSTDITDATLVNADIAAAAAIDWSKINKAGSSLADLTTRSASDLTSGTLAIARGGTGAGTAQAAIDNLSGLTTTGDLLYYDGANSTRLARGANGNCLQSSAISIAWVACAGLINLQNAYDNGNTITTSDARNLTLTFADTATDANLVVSTATGSTGFTTISRADGAGTADPAQLLLIDNLDLDRAQPIGLKLQSAAGGLTTAIDATDPEIVTALAIGSNTITTTTTTIAATELDLLDGHDVALVDTNDAVATAIIGSGALASGSIAAGFGTISTANTITGTTLNGTTGINTGAGAGTQRIDLSGNLVNIGNITGTGAIILSATNAALTLQTTTSGNIVINGAGSLDVQDATTFAGTAGFNGVATFNTDVDITLAGTENLAITSDLAGTVNVLSLVATPSASAGTTRGFFIQQADSANTNGLDQALYIDNADTNLAIPAAISIQNSGGGGYTTIIDNAGTLISGAELNLLDGHDVALVDTNDAVATAIVGTGALAAGSLAAGFTTVAVGQGGTGATTFTANGVLYGNTTGAIQVTAAGTTNQCLIATTGAAPSWGSCAGATTTLQNAYDNDGDGSDSIIALTTADDSLIFRNPAAGGSDSTYILTLDQLSTGARGGLSIQSAGTSNLLLITDTTATASDVMTIADGGATTFKNQTNSTTAFQIQNAAGTSLLTADTSNLLVTVGGDLKIGQSTDVWSKASQATAGTIASGGTSGIDRVHGMTAVYNGSLYVGTDKTNAAEVYRYDGGTTWTKVSQATAGTIASGGTASIDGINTMTIYNGSLYVGTLEASAAEVYRYDGGTTWTKVSQATAGTIASGGTALIDRVHGMTVHNGSLYINTQKTNAAEVYRYDGGTTWTKVSQATAGTIASGGTASINSAHTAAVHNGSLYIGTQKTGAAEVYRYDGGTTWTKVSQATAGTIASGGTASIDQIHGMAVHNGSLYVGTEKANAAEVYRYDGGTTWTKVSQATAGTIASGGTASIDGINTMAVYSGSLFLGTLETDAAEIYRYDGGTTWTKVSQATAGTIMSGGTTLVSGVQASAVYNGKLYFGTFKTGAAEVYGYSAVATLSTNGSNGLNVEINGTSVASLSKAGAGLFQNSTNSTTAFQVQNSAGGQLFNIDTTNAVLTLNGVNGAALQAWQTNDSSGFTAYGELATAAANGYIYRIGGSPDGSAGVTSVIYAKINASGSVGTWNSTSALPTTLSDQGAVAVNGYVYAVGGWNGTVVVDSVYYAKINPDGTLGSWTATSSLTAARGQPGVVAAGGYVYAVGGYNSTAQTTVYYAKINADGTLGTWATTSALSVARAFGGAAVANGYVYYMGGDDAAAAASNVVQYSQINATDGTLAAWATTSTLPSAATHVPAATLNGYLYTIGGKISGNPSSTVSYAKLNANGTTDAWANDTNTLPAAIQFSGAATYNGYLYSLGGYTNAAGTTPTSAVYYASASRIKVAGSLDLVGTSGQTLADSGSGGSLTAGNTSIIGSLQVRDQARLANGLAVLGASNFGAALFQNAADSTIAFQVQNAAGTKVLGIDTLNGGLITHAPATLLSGQSAFTQTISTNGPGTIDSFVQNVTVGATASISRGMHITVTDNNTLGSVNAGLLVSMEGTNTAQSQIGVEGSVNRGVGVSGISTGASAGNNSCSLTTTSIGVCGSSSAGTGVTGRSSAAGTSLSDTLGNGVSGVNNAVATAGNFYKGVRGVTTTNANAAYTAIGVAGQAKGGTGSTTYGGYFTLDSASTGTGAAIYGSNNTIATNILQLQDNTTDIFTIADAGAVTAKNSTDSTTAFQIQNAAGSSNLLIADTTNTILKVATAGSPTQAGTTLFATVGEFSGALRLGDGTNYAQFDGTTHELTLNGNARHTRRMILSPEYAGATMTADGASNTGTMTSDNMTSTPFRNFYKWLNTQGTAQDYDIWVRIPLPSDFAAMAATPTLSLDTYTSDTTNGTVLVTVYDTNNSADCTSASFTPTATTTWQSKTATTCLDTGTYAANGTITIDIKITGAATTGDTRISSLYFDYLSKW
ncbi:hypothetical protein HYS84_00355 [Candidatus Saccharibacteria bacterium]|nr:hypothetical protein [Candidatus Saccharibacteria bacterium]